jgi:hypothetical protein
LIDRKGMLTTNVFMQYGLTNKISVHIFNHRFRLTEYNPALVRILIFIGLTFQADVIHNAHNA